MELLDGLARCHTLVGDYVLARIVAFGAAVPEEQSTQQSWETIKKQCIGLNWQTYGYEALQSHSSLACIPGPILAVRLLVAVRRVSCTSTHSPNSGRRSPTDASTVAVQKHTATIRGMRRIILTHCLTLAGSSQSQYAGEKERAYISTTEHLGREVPVLITRDSSSHTRGTRHAASAAGLRIEDLPFVYPNPGSGRLREKLLGRKIIDSISSYRPTFLFGNLNISRPSPLHPFQTFWTISITFRRLFTFFPFAALCSLRAQGKHGGRSIKKDGPFRAALLQQLQSPWHPRGDVEG